MQIQYKNYVPLNTSLMFSFSFLDEFLEQGNDGMNLLVKLLKSIQTIGSQQSGSAKLSQLKNYKRTLVSILWNSERHEHFCTIDKYHKMTRY